MASEVLIKISKEEKEQARLLSELKYELDTQSRRAYAERQARKAIERATRKALREGKKTGMEEGELNGRLKERQEIARKMRDMGLSDEQIASILTPILPQTP